MLVMHLLSFIYHCIGWHCPDSPEQNILLQKAERYSCTYYCLSLFLARLRFFGNTTSHPFSSTLPCLILLNCNCPRTNHHGACGVPIEDQPFSPSYLHKKGPICLQAQHHRDPHFRPLNRPALIHSYYMRTARSKINILISSYIHA